jgi:hypothetical protein
MSKLVIEALQNVRDHAAKSPWDLRDTVYSYLSLSYIPSSRLTHLDRAIADEADWFVSSFADLARRRALAGYIVALVGDDGVGIAARQSQDPEIFDGRMRRAELGSFLESLQDGATTKLSANDAVVRGRPGYGFTHIVDSLKKSGGFASIHSGHYSAYFDGWKALGAGGLSGFECGKQERQFTPGTTLVVAIPLFRTPRIHNREIQRRAVSDQPELF